MRMDIKAHFIYIGKIYNSDLALHVRSKLKLNFNIKGELHP